MTIVSFHRQVFLEDSHSIWAPLAVLRDTAAIKQHMKRSTFGWFIWP